MIRSLWSKLVRLLSGEMDEHTLMNEVWRKAMHGYVLTAEEMALVATSPQTKMAISFAAANRAFGLHLREVAQAFQCKSPRQ